MRSSEIASPLYEVVDLKSVARNDRKRQSVLFGLFLVVVASVNVYAQQPNVENYLLLIESGQAEQVRAELPTLLNQYPNNPGVQFLQAVLTTDGAEAVRMYQSIVDNFPKSEWADDALFKVYKFYQAIGLYRTAEIKLNQLKTTYPDSKYVLGTTATETKQVAEQNVEAPQQSTQTVEVPKAEATKPEPLGKFALQVGVFSTPANADKQKMFFEYQKYPVEVVSKMKGSKELFYVFIGSYATADEAQTQGDEIKKSFNIDSIVVTR
jgi:cell division septation protein DedD